MRRRRLLVGILVAIFIFLTFLLFTYLKSISGKNKLKYPERVDCAAIQAFFMDVDGSINASTFYGFAAVDREPTMNIHGYGYYQCYCEEYSSIFKLWSHDATSDFCQAYNHDQVVGSVLANSVAVLISVINIILRTVNTKLIEYIGYPSVSRRTMNVMEAVFVTSFINTGIILLFTNADLQYSILSFIPIKQQYPDIGQNWYLDISSALAKTMLVMAVFPYFEFAIGFTMKTIYRLRDSGCFCCRKGRDKFRTKKVTLQ